MIFKYPDNLFEKLEFDKVLHLVEKNILGQKTKVTFYDTKIALDKDEVVKRLTEVSQWKAGIEEDNEIPIGKYESLEEDIPLLKKEGYVLSVDAIRRIYRMIHLGANVIRFFENHALRQRFPLLYHICSTIEIDAGLMVEIDRVLDREGNVRQDASPALAQINRMIRSKERELDEIFRTILKKYASLGYLADTQESMRYGRRVLTVAVENKRKIPGIIHDQSATGKTIYLEPQEVMQINNEIFNLYTERQAEMYRVLRDLCTTIRPYADNLLDIEKEITRLDIIRAKAYLAILMDAHQPEILDKPHFGFKKAYNPVLLVVNNEQNKPTIPFDLTLHGANRILVLSGPNAGGKSVTMKSVGLLQLMIQFGMLIPADPNSKVGLFAKICVDIGDQQSIEDDLSTYSSRLLNMKYFLDHADRHSLVLIDEFGSGTDPKIGGAIAEAILRQLNFQKVFGVVTTHYSNLKYFAFKTKGILNGSMEFDKSKLLPTYQLIVGKPGSSFAYEIAQKSGLPEKIISYARHKTGKNEKAIEELLTNLQAEKKEIEQRMHKLLDDQDKVDKMAISYRELFKELEYRRKKLKLRQKETQFKEEAMTTRKMEAILRELKQAKSETQVKKMIDNHRRKRDELHKEVKNLANEIYQVDDPQDVKIVEGGYAKMRDSEMTGRVEKLYKNKALITVGTMSVEVPLVDLLPAREPIVSKKKSVDTSEVRKTGNFDPKLDIRGYTKKDAEVYVTEFLDQALLHNAAQLKVIHGKGNGVLRQVVISKIKEYRDIKSYWHPEEEFGGEGVTIIEM